ncbi:60s acidic ribosomal protein [Coprinopsis cinerea AmutBmut pab1-1]|nr:60s acidic ribosomal protein [Coprinopsis cinerea AmutBmut pab1-1]
MSTRKTPVPLLLDSFPVPPSHIPLTPTAASPNPPPSRPPSVPLPPVPGPSRISEADTLQLLLLSSRSRRSSKYSLAGSDTNRDSVISTSSNGHGAPPSSPLPPAATRPGTRGSLASSPHRPSIAFSIDEEEEPGQRPLILRDVVSPMLPLSDDDGDSTTLSPRRRRGRHQANESISSIDMRDIMGAASGVEDEEEDDPEPFVLPLSKAIGSEKPTSRGPAGSSDSSVVPPTSASHARKSSLAYLNFEHPTDSISNRPSSVDMSDSQSTSDSYNDLASASTTTLRSSSMANIRASSSSQSDIPISPTPRSKKPYTLNSSIRSIQSASTDDARSASPDIDTIIQSTPKPIRLSNARSFSMSSNGKRSRVSSLRSVRSEKSIKADTDEFGVLATPMRLSKSTIGKKSHPDDSLDYIVRGEWDHHVEVDEAKLRALEKESDGDDSDSSLDLHTPLPHLMVRHGLLSSNSKLLQGDSRATTPHCGGDGRPMSSMSTATKSGVMKDERDTPMRRVRHRDGRLLRGGVGLTTGLGWSDSEDEDAPSPLTRRLSTLNLSRRSSASSFFSTSSRPHPLSRSYSSGTLYDDAGFGFGFDGPPMEDDEEVMKDTSDWALRHRKPSNPPTAWQRRSGASASTRNSVASSGGRHSIASSGGRLSIASNGSTFSLEVTSPEDDSGRSPLRRSFTRESISSAESTFNRRSGDSQINTPSTASTMSIPLPVTPQQDPHVPSHVLSSKKPYLDKDKSLPPLPGVLKKTTSRSALSTPPSKMAIPRARTFSSTSSSVSTSPAVTQSTPAPVRPLQLPRQIRASTRGGDRPAVPVPQLSSSTSSIRPPSNIDSGLPSPSKPRPRTGTGMVYKTSTSRVRAPMSLQSNSSIGRPGGIPRP